MKRQSTTTKITKQSARLLAAALEDLRTNEGIIVRHRGVEMVLNTIPSNIKIMRGESTSQLTLTQHYRGGWRFWFLPTKALTIRKATIEALRSEYAQA